MSDHENLPQVPETYPQLLKHIGATLEASAAEQTWTVTGSTNYEASKATQPKCVQVIQGQFF